MRKASVLCTCVPYALPVVIAGSTAIGNEKLNMSVAATDVPANEEEDKE